jgi:hypothetical protein
VSDHLPMGHEAGSSSAAASHDDDERVYDTVQLSEMEYVEEEATYYYECPCGDMFEISEVRPSAPCHAPNVLHLPQCLHAAFSRRRTWPKE